MPRDDRAVESETYSFEAGSSARTAHRSPQLSREAERLFTRRVEGDYQRIQRHGDPPATYWWEVHDKVGNKYFYGRTPDGDVPEAIERPYSVRPAGAFRSPGCRRVRPDSDWPTRPA